MNYLITGGAGFLGTTLCNRLARQGHTVRALDDCSTGDPSGLASQVEFIKGDVNDKPLLWTLLRDIDCVFHLAALVSVPESSLFPSEYNRINVSGTVNLMEAIRDAKVGRVVFASSGAIYGKLDHIPYKETDEVLPGSPGAVAGLPSSMPPDPILLSHSMNISPPVCVASAFTPKPVNLARTCWWK